MQCYPGPVAREDSAASMPAHIDEDTLELYAMNRLPEADAAPVEEHLLVCPHCQDRLIEIDRLLADLNSSLGPPQ